jgi:hypothetical protein
MCENELISIETVTIPRSEYDRLLNSDIRLDIVKGIFDMDVYEHQKIEFLKFVFCIKPKGGE